MRFVNTPYVGDDPIWHAGNDGHLSGLDADTLDGYQADTGTTASTVPVRDANGVLPGAVEHVPWSGVTTPPTSLAGYGILDSIPISGAVSITFDAIANRPSAGTPGRIYVALDAHTISQDNGVTWVTLLDGGLEHEHANSSLLDDIDQSLATDAAVEFAGLTVIGPSVFSGDATFDTEATLIEFSALVDNVPEVVVSLDRSTLAVGVGRSGGDARLHVMGRSGVTPTMIVQAVTGGSGPLLELQAINGDPVASITNTGGAQFDSTVRAGGFLSSDGTAGATATTGGLVFKNGLYTSGDVVSPIDWDTLYERIALDGGIF